MKKDIVVAAVSVVLIAGVTFGLAALSRDLPLSPSQPFTAASSAAQPATLLPDDKVVMRVNGEPVSEREFMAFLENAPEEARPLYASPQGRHAIAEELVRLKVLEQEARRLGIADSPEVVTQINMARSQITAGRALQAIVEKVADEKMRAAFEQEKATSVTLRHILVAFAGGAVPPRDGAEPLSEAAAMQKAQRLAGMIKAGADFEQVARAESDDQQSGAEGGMLGPARPDMLPPDIAPTVARLQPGQISEPTKTQFGIHIFRVEEPSLEQLTPMIRQRVMQQTAQEEMTRLQKGAKVDLDPKFFPQAPQGGVPPGAPVPQPGRGTPQPQS
ncbi:MAG TPA: peptidylprolyl isomerase [Thermoanaerobaculia bacterium]